jgi:hypothetical protein
MKTLKGILGALLLFGAVIARADEVVVLERDASDFDTWAAQTNGRERVLDAISRETGVPVTTLETQREQTRLGYGGLFIANKLAAATGQTFDQIAALKASGHGWGWIAKQNNVKLGPIISSARNANKPFKDEQAKTKKVKSSGDDDADRGPGNSHGNSNGKGPKMKASHSNGHGHGKGH